jgi:hypothetical protein
MCCSFEVRHLDAQKLQVLFVVSADDAVRAQQRFAVFATQTNHGEVAVGKTQRGVARGGEAKQAVGPVVDGQNFFVEESTHERNKTQ